MGRNIQRNTSTDVEKTAAKIIASCKDRKHLHGRGEDFPVLTPVTHIGRNTSTDVEKTLKSPPVKAIDRKPLHGRGEDATSIASQPQGGETPPRTWRRPFVNLWYTGTARNTSTDVEKTWRVLTRHSKGWKHLHGRGEDEQRRPGSWWNSETPPRTWRRQLIGRHLSSGVGNTSTDVEKTTVIASNW